MRANSYVPQSAADAMLMATAAADYLNSPAAGLNGAGCGEILPALAGVCDKLAAARAEFLRRFDAASAHDADGYGSSSGWLVAKCRMSKRAAHAAVRQMRRFAARPVLHEGLAAGDVSESWAADIADWIRKLPKEMQQETDKILLEAARQGANLQDLATIAGYAVEKWRQQQPDSDGFDFKDRSLRLGTTFDGAGVLRGELSPDCAAAVAAVLEALGKRDTGGEDLRSQEQRFHDALQEACQLLLGARMVPDTAGADTQAVVHIPLSQLRDMPGAEDLEDEWLRGRLGEGEPGYLDGDDARAAACGALTVPVVTGDADMTVIDKIIALASAVPDLAGLSPEAWQAHRYAIARLAIDFVSGPGGIAASLRTGLLDRPYSTPSLPLDIGWSESIPASIRRAVRLRDKHCSWPGCKRRAAWCDVHHIAHKKKGGKTSVKNCVLLCQFHHDVCIHRWGWEFTLHPDGTTEARSPDGEQILHSHAPPIAR